MSKIIRTNLNDFNELNQFASAYDVPGRTKSVALLLWFLNTVFRLDEIEAQDSVCDKQGDAGFDAIAIDDIHQEIAVFQSKRRDNLPATLGDVDLKTFIGSLSQIATPDSVNQLARTTINAELRSLINDLDLASKVKAGYRQRAIFVTNVAANSDAQAYIEQANRDGKILDVWDSARLSPVLRQLHRDWFVTEEIRLSVNPAKLFAVAETKGKPNLVFAAIQAKSLVSLPGIDDSRLFAQNVRLGLGNTRVNDDIEATIKAKTEHSSFLTFHNGLTLVAKAINLRGKTLRIKDFSVCNGCQSLLAFYNNRKLLSNDLEVLVRIVKVGDDRRLPEVIAYRTNNQNAISLRDLSSNDVTQVRIQTEFNQLFGQMSYYAIKRGEQDAVPTFPNELAGRLLLALYVGEPWSTHQKYRVFGDLESRIFTYHIGSSHIRLAYLLYNAILPLIATIENQRLAHYGLTHFLILFLLGNLLGNSIEGKHLLENPLEILSTNSNINPKESIVIDKCQAIIQWLITELNYTIRELGGDSYDYKREFKSPKAVIGIRDSLLKAFDKDKYRNRAPEFIL
jgi:hypothetical protein